jgi:formate dehydrogenase major subunit
LEAPVSNLLYPDQQSNPAVMRDERPENRYASSPDDRFPYVMSTYRLTEHHTSGAMSRMLPHLAELQPEFFCEISPDLAFRTRNFAGATLIAHCGRELSVG